VSSPVLTSLFSREYSLQGVVMIETFRRLHPGARVVILALDLETKKFLQLVFEDKIEIVCLLDNSGLLNIFDEFRNVRTLAETIFTLKVYWLDYLAEGLFDSTKILYADADVYFLAPVQLPKDKEWSILISPHVFPQSLMDLNRSGIYNAGFVGFNLCKESRNILKWWRSQVEDSCSTSKELGTYADQKYIEEFPSLGKNVRNFPQLGINVGMWQVSRKRKVMNSKNSFFIAGSPIIAFHFHGFRSNGVFVRKGMFRYTIPFGSIRSLFHLYGLYISELWSCARNWQNAELPMYFHAMSISSEIRQALRRPSHFLDLSLLPRDLNRWKSFES
jgi:hypothetical protein